MYCTSGLITCCFLFANIPMWPCSHYSGNAGEHCYASNSKGNCEKTSVGRRYLLYDVNPPEGFNLRRDVFIRIAVLTKKLQEYGNWTLVLPPWTALYHWKSSDVGDQYNLPWGMFFDVESIGNFVPVVELSEFLEGTGNNIIDEVYVLQHFKNAWENNDWKDKMAVEQCHESLHYWLNDNGFFEGEFWDNGDLMSAKTVQCLSFQGPASYIIPVLLGKEKIKKGWSGSPHLTPLRTMMIDRAEVLLHDEFGSSEYWRARRSMRFARHLVLEATKYRGQILNSFDEEDGTIRPEDWRNETPHELNDQKKGSGIVFTKGGPYLCVHLRRQDFLWGRSAQVPSLKWAALQVLNHLKKLNLSAVFIATDAPDKEVNEFSHYIGGEYRVVQWKPSVEQKKVYKDGGIAIIEQIICSHSRYFIGTHESTYSFRIQEEREIMGFHPDSTFNRLCGGDVPVEGKESNCERPSRWRIVF